MRLPYRYNRYCLFKIFQGQVELVGIELFRAPAELHPLHLAKQLAQPIVLAGELIALFDKPPFLGPLGIALGPGRQHQGAQPRNIVGKGIGRRHARDYLISPARCDPQPQGESTCRRPRKTKARLSRPPAAV